MGLPQQYCVETEVAPSRSYGRSRTEINDSNMVGSTAIPVADNINRERPSCKVSPGNVANVETKVIASQSYGRSHTDINHFNMNETEIDAVEIANGTTDTNHNATIHNNDAISNNGTDPNSHNTPKRGFQHIYKSTKTSSSLRVHAAHNATITNNTPRNKNAIKRSGKKRNKMEKLRHVVCSPRHSRTLDFFKNEPVFFSGTSERIVPNPVPNSRVLSAIKDLTVVDTVDGAQMILDNEDFVFILVPRSNSIRNQTHVNDTLATLRAVNKAKNSAETRGKTRIPVSEDRGKYTTIGLKPNRGCPGITESWPDKLSEADRWNIVHLMNTCEELAKGYLPSDALRGIENARKVGNWHSIKTGASPPKIWSSLAIGLNYYLNAHTDQDFFYSVTTIASAHGLQEHIDRYSMETEVCNYFTFPEQGIAVALRPGDMLLFNPPYQHCLSSRTSFYKNKDVFCLSLYLKTAIVGKNDNTLPLTDADMYSLEQR